jgi:hypothetical protein
VRNLDDEQLRTLSTPDLVRHALEEAKLLVKAEVMHAKQELRLEVKQARVSGILGGVGLALALTALSLFFVGIALALPMAEVGALFLVGLIVLAVAGLCGFLAYKKAPRKPLPRTQERLKKDLAITREQLA